MNIRSKALNVTDIVLEQLKPFRILLTHFLHIN